MDRESDRKGWRPGDPPPFDSRPADASDERPDCGECGDTGFVLDRETRPPIARRCPCRARRVSEDRLDTLRIPERYADCTFESFNPVTRDLADARMRTRRLIEGFPGERYGLLFTGRCGVGKTHLAVAALRELTARCPSARGLFVECGHLLRQILDTFDRRSETPSKAVIQPVLTADILILDDLGAARMTPFARDTFSLIINERYNGNLLTLVTTNYPPGGAGVEHESLEDRVGERIASRLSQMCRIVHIEGQDFRRQFKRASFSDVD